jgi:hypothetical protein
MAIKDSSGYTEGFKWTDEEANLMSDAIINLSLCVNKERSMLPQVFQNLLSTINLSTNCTAGRKNEVIPSDVVILPTVPTLNSTNSSFVINNGSVPSGRLLKSLRFLQDSNTSTQITNETTSQPTLVRSSPLITNDSYVMHSNETHNVTSDNRTASNITRPSEPFIIPVISTEPVSNRTLNATPTTNYTTPTTPITVDFNVTPIVVPAIPAPIINPPNGRSLIQVSLMNANLTNMTAADIIPAQKNEINPNFTRTLLIGNMSTPVLVRNLLDFAKNDTNVYNSLVQSIKTSMQIKGENFMVLANMMNKGLLSDYEYNCLQGGAIAFLYNIENNSLLINEFLNNKCGHQENYTIILSNGTTACDNCNEKILMKNLTFIDKTKQPSYYFYSSSCLSGKKVVFAYWIDQTGIPLVTYYDRQVNLNKICLSKAFSCASEAPKQNYCPINNLNVQCRNEISQSCRKSDFFKLIDSTKYFDKYDFILPVSCDVTNTNGNFTQMNSRCLSWFYSTFITGAINLNVNTTSDFDRILYTTQTVARLLQAEPAVVTASPQQTLVIIDKSLDPTLKDSFAEAIKNITIPNADIVVDGMRITDNATVVLKDYMGNLKIPPIKGEEITQTKTPVKNANAVSTEVNYIYLTLLALAIFLV